VLGGPSTGHAGVAARCTLSGSTPGATPPTRRSSH